MPPPRQPRKAALDARVQGGTVAALAQLLQHAVAEPAVCKQQCRWQREAEHEQVLLQCVRAWQ